MIKFYKNVILKRFFLVQNYQNGVKGHDRETHFIV